MPYEKLVQRRHPALIQMILDDSGSMKSNMSGTDDARYQCVEHSSGRILSELLQRCTDMSGATPAIHPRYYIDVLKYGSSVIPWTSEELDIGEAVRQFDAANGSFGLGGRLDGTDAAQAFQVAHDRLQVMINRERYRDSFPPLIFHLTDGESQTDAEPIAQKLSALATADGNLLICNAYIGTRTSLQYADNRDFPGYTTETEVGTNADNLRLFRMSSVLPETIRQNLIADEIFPALRPGSRLFFDVRTKDMLQHVMQIVGSVSNSRAHV